MRTVNYRLAVTLPLTLSSVACMSGVSVVRPVPRPAPVVYVEPLEVDIARPHQGKLFVQTNRAAYVAIFEIIPERGVELVYPESSRHRQFVVAGLRDVPVWWEGSRVTYHSGWSTSRAYPGRYIYALASDEPLRIPDAAYRTGYLRDVLGPRVYWSANPYETMRALAREFAPPVREEEWAEDMYVVSPTYATEHYRVTRVYCRGGSVFEVPREFADRLWCPTYVGVERGRGRVTDVELPGSRRPMVRPDSVVEDNGRRAVTRGYESTGPGAIHRVKEPPIVVPNERADVPPPPRGRKVAIVDDRGAPKPDANGGSKADSATTSRPDSAGGPKPQPTGDTRAEPKKGHGRSRGKDDKRGDDKSKEPTKP